MFMIWLQSVTWRNVLYLLFLPLPILMISSSLIIQWSFIKHTLETKIWCALKAIITAHGLISSLIALWSFSIILSKSARSCVMTTKNLRAPFSKLKKTKVILRARAAVCLDQRNLHTEWESPQWGSLNSWTQSFSEKMGNYLRAWWATSENNLKMTTMYCSIINKKTGKDFKMKMKRCARS